MTYFAFTRRSSTLPLQTYVTRCFGNTLAHAGQASPRRRTPDGTSLPLPLLRYAPPPGGHSQLGLVPGATPGSVGPAEHTGGRPRKDVVEGEALLHMEELGNYTLKYLARRRTRKPPHDLVTGQTPDYMLSN